MKRDNPAEAAHTPLTQTLLCFSACFSGAEDCSTPRYILPHVLHLVADRIIADDSLLRYQKHLARQELLIVDELGFVPLSKTGAEMLFEVFSQRYERAATLVTSNLLCGAPHNRFNAESIFMRSGRP